MHQKIPLCNFSILKKLTEKAGFCESLFNLISAKMFAKKNSCKLLILKKKKQIDVMQFCIFSQRLEKL
jgi:hypothetical protein